jgi:CBS domain-containing protein
LLKSAAVGALAVAAAVALWDGEQRDLEGHSVASWPGSGAASAEPHVHSLEREHQLARAFAAAFGGSDEVIRRVGAMREPTRFRAGLLVSAPFGPVLLSEGEVLAPRAASTGKLAAVYLARAGHGFRPQAQYLPAIESGSMGRLAEWSVRTDLGRYPVVEVKGAGSWRGSTCSWTTLLELTPDGPAELVTIPTAFDNSEALLDGSPTRVEGRIRGVATGRSIVVAYSGSAAFTERFVRQGSRYVRAGGGQSRMKSC